MKFTSIFFKTNESILEGYLKETKRNAKMPINVYQYFANKILIKNH